MHVPGRHPALLEVPVVKPLAPCLIALLLASGCSNDDLPAPAASASVPSSSAPLPAAANPARVAELLRIEDARAIGDVTDDDLRASDPRVRAAAVRALARAEQGAARDRLLSTLADRDPDVLAWSAYGLGEVCAWDRDRTARRLITRAVALGVEPPAPAGTLDPWFALALALGKCGNLEAENTLVAWLSGPKDRSIAAATSLGNVVTRHARMSEETAAALLRSTRGDAANDPLTEALFPFGRLKRAPVRVEEQLLEACRTRLGHDVPSRVFVLRALATLLDEGVSLLGSVLLADAGYSSAEQAEAARSLGKIGSQEAQKVLLQAVDKLAPPNDPIALTALVGPRFGVLTTVLASIQVSGDRRVQSKGIDALLALDTPPNAPAPVSRRVAVLRCSAARLVAGRNFRHGKLVGCDPAHGAVEKLAQLAVIDRGDLKGTRLAAWQAHLDTNQAPVVREAALRMLAGHPEAKGIIHLIAKALSDQVPGVVEAAATLVFTHPGRFEVEGKGGATSPDPSIVKALVQAAKREHAPDDIETIGAIVRACGQLQIAETKAWIETLCASPNPTLRDHAQRALGSFPGPKRKCEPGDARYAPARELERLVTGPQTLELETDAGKLTIELGANLAPVAATRVADLVKSGFYDGIAVHRVVPGFVVQFGDKRGDGFGGAGAEALRCETSPVPFAGGVVGVALGGRDTGSSQLFVTLAPAPHLDGEYAVVGTAKGPWDTLAEGDIIRSARMVE